MIDDTIYSIVKDNLCTGCGTCVSLCPNNAITLTIDANKGIYVPVVDPDGCNNCGTCRLVCPGGELDFNELNLEIFGKRSDDDLLGNYINCYIGNATDEDIRYNSSSGGLITALLIFALEEKIIDGALVTRMKKDRPLEPEPFIARTREEIIEASKSKYCPVPANIALNKILEAQDGERFAVVGLPCHIHGIRKAQKINKKLRERIVLSLGLFCAGTPSFKGTKYLIYKIAKLKHEIKKIDYRGNGWPGVMTIISKNSNKTTITYKDMWRFFGQFFYHPKRCTMCCDGVNEFSDISFGDAWIPECYQDNLGTSLILSRTNRGEQLLKNSRSHFAVDVSLTKKENIVRSQKYMLYYKKVLALQSRFNKNRPFYNINPKPKINILNLSLEIIQKINIYCSTNKNSEKILILIPSKFLEFYQLFTNIILLINIKKFFKKNH